MRADPFVGRHVELDVLTRAIVAATAGQGSIVLLTGEPGIGKSRLAAFASEHAVSSGMSVRTAACWEEPSAPFWPWVQLLRPDLDPSAPADVRRLVGDVDTVGHGGGLDGDAEPVRLALFDVVSRHIAELASGTPMLLVLDDLHWADMPSLRLLAYFARSVRSAAVLVIGTFRDVEVDRDSDTGRALGSVCAAGEVLRLEGLRTGEVAELLAAGAGVLAPTDFARDVHARTGGNPLFVRELSRLLGAPGRRPEDIASLPVPEGVHGVIRRRVARLSQPTQELLSIAAVFGPAFRADLIARAAQQPSDVALDLLDTAVEARLVTVDDPALGRFAFSHALVRDVLYESIPPSRRAAMHLRVADAIESSAPVESNLPELAFHHLRASLAGDPRKGIDFSVRAGRRALDQLAYEDAAAHFARALAASDTTSDDDLRTELLLELGDARLRAGDMPGARTAYEDAAAAARLRERPDDLARAALGFGAGLAGFEVQLFDERQIELIEEALATLPTDDSALRASLLARLSVALSIQESVERRRDVATDAVAMARRVGDDRALAYALSAHCDAIAGPDDCERRLEESAEIIRIARTIGDRALELLGRRLRVLALLETGDIHAVDVEIEQYASVADGIRQPLYLWYVALWRGMRALMRGEFDEAFARADEATLIGERAHSVNAQMLTRVLRWIASDHQGRPHDAYGHMAQLTELMPGWGNPYFALGDSWMFAAMGESEQARAAFRRLPDPSGVWIQSDAEWLPSMCQVAYSVSLLGEREAAAAAYERLLPHRKRFGIEGIGAAVHGSIEHHLGLLARTAGRLEDAITHFGSALVSNGSIGAPLLEARTMLELASTISLSDAGPTPVRAAELRARASAILAGLGVSDRDRPAGQPSAPAAVPTGPNGFRAEGELWALAFAGVSVRVKDAKGLHDIARLLARPGTEIAALDLVAEHGSAPARRLPPEEFGTPGHVGEVLDDEARARYKARLDELAGDIDEGEALGDPVRVERAKNERDTIVRELSAAYGLGGRPRRAGDPGERARTTVTRRIRDAITRISDVHPSLGRHLRNSVRTGTFCSYVPEQPVDWEL